MSFPRAYKYQKHSFFLFGPRGVGKSTLIRTQVKPDLELDLLKSSLFRELQKSPSNIDEFVGHLVAGDTVFIDEIQRVPELLNEVHRLIEAKGLIFYLTGSSARSLKKVGVNLLAGRAYTYRMYPLTFYEIEKYELQTRLQFGNLPAVVSQKSDAKEFLKSYVDTYLREEIAQEAVTRNLKDFSLFLELLAQNHAQIVNYENIASRVGKSGDSIKSWFQVIEDTLVGIRLEAFKLGAFPKEVRHPKFFCFDSGIVNALTGDLDAPIESSKKGFLFEGLILNEIKTYLECKRKNLNIYFYAVPTKGDVDFIVETKKKSIEKKQSYITIDVKMNKEWKSEFGKMSYLLKESNKPPSRMLGVYLGAERRTRGDYEVFPFKDFVNLLWKGEFF